MSSVNSSSATNSSTSWIYALNVEDGTFVIISTFIIFTLTTGFAFLEAGCVSKINEVNIMMKTVIDVVLGGFTYWLFGFGFTFGRSQFSNPFIGIGDFLVDPFVDDPLFGATFTAFFFQLSFATTATTIVSGAMAERCNFKAYCLYVLLNTVTYSIAAGWVWGDHGFLKKLGVVDIAGSGPIHLVGGSSALMAAIMLGPRLGRFSNGTDGPPLGSPINVIIGLFILWWAWLAFNAGSTYGVSGGKWAYAGRAGVMTMLSSIGGGIFGLSFALFKSRGETVDIVMVVNGILGALVGITAGCYLYSSWESIIIGMIGGAFTCITQPLFDKMRIDDPVGAVSVHFVGGIWGVICVGLFASNPKPLDTTGGLSGLFRGGGWYLLGVQTLACLCYITWSMFVTFIILWIVNKIIPLRMKPYEELLGADLTEHNIRHAGGGVSRALSALRPINSHTNHLDAIPKGGINPNIAMKINELYNSTHKHQIGVTQLAVTGQDNMDDVKDGTYYNFNGSNRFFKGFIQKKSSGFKTMKTKKIQSAINMFSTYPTHNSKPPQYAWID